MRSSEAWLAFDFEPTAIMPHNNRHVQQNFVET
jgi:hypothetical protein